ncbi:MAG TPA: lysophospholipase [Candidatus Dormibacteraeota bacterium]|nr:lysophospholipase [Candidatus Dormibacteraeota bacterium]
MATEAGTATRFLTSRDGTRLAYRAWPLADAKITLAVVHGLGEHAGRYLDFAVAMATRGIGTFAVDLRGHGQSAGQRGHVDSWTQWTEDISAFVAEVGRQTGGEVVPLGHSFGGAAMLSTVLAGKVPDAKRFIVSSPALRAKVKVPQWKTTLGSVTSRFVPRLALSNEVDAGTISRIPDVVTAYRTDPLVHSKISSRLYTEWQGATLDVLGRAGEIKVPFLILAGTDDQLIDPSGSEELHRRAAQTSELHLLQGRYHEPFNDLGRDEVFDIIDRWLGRP